MKYLRSGIIFLSFISVGALAMQSELALTVRPEDEGYVRLSSLVNLVGYTKAKEYGDAISVNKSAFEVLQLAKKTLPDDLIFEIKNRCISDIYRNKVSLYHTARSGFYDGGCLSIALDSDNNQLFAGGFWGYIAAIDITTKQKKSNFYIGCSPEYMKIENGELKMLVSGTGIAGLTLVVDPKTCRIVREDINAIDNPCKLQMQYGCLTFDFKCKEIGRLKYKAKITITDNETNNKIFSVDDPNKFATTASSTAIGKKGEMFIARVCSGNSIFEMRPAVNYEKAKKEDFFTTGIVSSGIEKEIINEHKRDGDGCIIL